MKNNTVVKIVLILFIFSSPIFAQEKKEQKKLPQKDLEKKAVNKDRYVISRLNGAVKLDGLSDEPAWEDIEPLPVVMHSPNFLDEPTEQTEILVAYDNDYLYTAGRLYDREPSKIQCTSKKRDDMKPNNDWFGIVIDTFNDKENALVFFTTPSGLRLDMAVFNDAQGELPFNTDWNTFWDVATERNKDGWFVEMRIPLSSLQFQDKDGNCVMGLISWRWIARKNESIVFPAISPNWGMYSLFKPSQAQEVVFQGIPQEEASVSCSLHTRRIWAFLRTQ